MEEKNWLSELKEGDEVYMSNSNYLPSHGIVSKITKTQIVIGKDRTVRRFNKEKGVEIGNDCWHFCYLIRPTPELEKKIRLSNLRSAAKDVLSKIQIPTTEEGINEFINTISKYL